MPSGPLTGVRVLVVVAPEDYRDEELLEPKRILEEVGATVDVASTKKGKAKGMKGGSVQATVALAEVDAKAYDAVLVVGGNGSAKFLWDDSSLRRILKIVAGQGKTVGAICLSGAVLAFAGLLNGRRATVWDDPKAIQALKDNGARYVPRGPIVDGNIVTGYGPEEAAAFGEAVRDLITTMRKTRKASL